MSLIVELVQALCRDQQASPNALENLQKGRLIGSLGSHPETLERLFDELRQAAKVEVRFFTRVIDADVDPQSINFQATDQAFYGMYSLAVIWRQCVTMPSLTVQVTLSPKRLEVGVT